LHERREAGKARLLAEGAVEGNRPKIRYIGVMTKLLEKALEAVRVLSPDEQDEIAQLMLQLAANDGEPEQIDPADLPHVLEGLAQMRRGEFATDEEVEAAFRRFDP
jgi:DNA-binding TFAR19-related protein (PDSD5 family)